MGGEQLLEGEGDDDGLIGAARHGPGGWLHPVLGRLGRRFRGARWNLARPGAKRASPGLSHAWRKET
jgi:hypothetical protein